MDTPALGTMKLQGPIGASASRASFLGGAILGELDLLCVRQSHVRVEHVRDEARKGGKEKSYF